jgi:hypothetical protein
VSVDVIDWCPLSHRRPSRAEIGRICAHHAAAITETLQDILEFWALLPLYLIPSQDGHDSGSKREKAADAPAPLRVDVLALTDHRNPAARDPGDQPWWAPIDVPDVAGVLTAWVALAVAADTPPPLTVPTAVRALQAHNHRLAGMDCLPDYWTELRRVRSALAAANSEPPPRPVGRCPTLDGDGNTCDGPLWADRHGPEPASPLRVTCSTCGRVFDEPMLRHLGSLLTAG